MSEEIGGEQREITNWKELRKDLLGALVKSTPEFQEKLIEAFSEDPSTRFSRIEFVKNGRVHVLEPYMGGLSLDILHEGMTLEKLPVGEEGLKYRDAYDLSQERGLTHGVHVVTRVNGDEQRDNKVANDRFRTLISSFGSPTSQ